MNEAVDQVLEEREALEKGLTPSLVLSVIVHLLVLGGSFAASWLRTPEPLLKTGEDVMIALPRGGGGPVAPDPAPAAPAPKQSTAPEAPAPAPEPPKVIKPPKEVVEPKHALPPPEPKKTKARPTPTPPPRAAARPFAPEPFDLKPGAGSTRGATGTSNQTPGLGIIGPAGPGVPTGTDTGGDYYLAGVQRKIWMIWMRQIKTGHQRDIGVSFTILADGSLEDGSVRVVQSGGVSLLDLAAQRSVFSAAPFGPLPRNYGTNRITIQALFQPVP